MTESFAQRLLAAVRDEATARNMRGARAKTLRVLLGGMTRAERHRLIGRASLPSLMTAVTESADRFTPLDRRRFELHAELPDWFWPWVEARAKWWDETP